MCCGKPAVGRACKQCGNESEYVIRTLVVDPKTDEPVDMRRIHADQPFLSVDGTYHHELPERSQRRD
jgi:hypothetical protein